MAVADIAHPPVPPEVFADHPGEWVAIRDGQVVAAAKTVEDLERDERVEPTDTLFLVPEPSTHFFPSRRG